MNPYTEEDEPGLFLSREFYLGAFLSVCAWSAFAVFAITYFN